MKRLILVLGALLAVSAASAQSVLDATLAEPDQKTQEVSTSQLRQILADGSAVVLDARPRREYAVSHIPGAVNVAPRPGLPPHLYVSDVAEVGRLLNGARDRPLVLYCNGPSCGKSRRLAAELLTAGFTNVRRYQLGASGWRAFGGAMRTLPEALPYLAGDRTAVWIDARESATFARGSLSGARNLPRSGLRPGKDQGVMREAKDDGRLPMEDHNTRIIVFGADGQDARAVAEAIAGEAFHNVSFLAEPFDEVRRARR
jgi:rhodanese-related sulfurtransferase